MTKHALLPAIAGFVLGFAFAVPKQAFALGPVDIEVAAKAGVGTNPEKTSGFPNPLGFGLGGRAGVSIFGIYGGATIRYYFGSGTDITIPAVGTAHESNTSLMYGIEGGYTIGIPLIKLRPQVGIGSYTVSSSITNEPTIVNGSIYIEPSIQALLYLGTAMIGADAGLLLLPGLDNWQPALTLNAQLGMKF